jgi:hypothetical protein
MTITQAMTLTDARTGLLPSGNAKGVLGVPVHPAPSRAVHRPRAALDAVVPPRYALQFVPVLVQPGPVQPGERILAVSDSLGHLAPGLAMRGDRRGLASSAAGVRRRSRSPGRPRDPRRRQRPTRTP